MKQFSGRVVIKGAVSAEALVSRAEFNLQASYRKTMLYRPCVTVCNDENNPELYGKKMSGKALCLSHAVGPTNGGISFCCSTKKDKHPACLLFAEHIDTITAGGVVLSEIWNNDSIPTIDNLGYDFLNSVHEGMMVSVSEDGIVTIE